MFQVRVQVFQVQTAADRSSTVTTSPAEGPAVDTDGNPTPILHLYWRGAHFEPLFSTDTRAAMPGTGLG
jgi:hypothetical protein